MKAHIGADAESGLVHAVTTVPANAHDVTQKVKTCIRATVEHPFRVIYAKARLGIA